MSIFRWLALVAGSVLVLTATGRDNEPPTVEKPDLIVSDLSLKGDELVLEVQNQGPGTAKRGAKVEVVVSGSLQVLVKDKATGKDKVEWKPVSATVTVPVPEKVMATETVKIPPSKFGVKELADFSPLLTVNLDPKGTLDEERKGNNTYYRQLDSVGRELPRGDYKTGTELPDLVIRDITQDGINLVVHYTNIGKGSTGADFLISIQCGKQKFDGNHFYRFRVPAPAADTKTGGFNCSLIGLKSGDAAEIEATIDWENRVRETDKKNNTFKKTVKIE